jgi:hypothetical protein
VRFENLSGSLCMPAVFFAVGRGHGADKSIDIVHGFSFRPPWRGRMTMSAGHRRKCARLSRIPGFHAR